MFINTYKTESYLGFRCDNPDDVVMIELFLGVNGEIIIDEDGPYYCFLKYSEINENIICSILFDDIINNYDNLKIDKDILDNEVFKWYRKMFLCKIIE